MVNKEQLQRAARGYLAGLVIYGVALWFYFHNGYYVSFLSEETKWLLKILYGMYVVLGLPMLVLESRKGGIRVHKPVETVIALREMIKGLRSFTLGFLPGKKRWRYKVERQYKVTLRFMAVKIFYVPLMLNFFFDNLQAVMNRVTGLPLYATASPGATAKAALLAVAPPPPQPDRRAMRPKEAAVTSDDNQDRRCVVLNNLTPLFVQFRQIAAKPHVPLYNKAWKNIKQYNVL